MTRIEMKSIKNPESYRIARAVLLPLLRTVVITSTIVLVTLSLSSSRVFALEWQQLEAEQQKLLAPVESGWNSMSTQKQQKLLAAAERWKTMDPAQRAAYRDRLERWQQYTPEQKKAIKQRFRQFQNLSKSQQAKVRKSFKRFQQLKPDQRQKLRARWRDLSSTQRKRILRKLKNRPTRDRVQSAD